MKREERHQLKADRFIDIIKQGIAFIGDHKQKFLMGIAGLAVLFLIVMGFRFLQSQGLKKENQRLARIIQINEQLPENPDLLAELEELAGGGRFTRIGYIYIASFHLGREDYDKALAALELMPGTRRDVIYFQGEALKGRILAAQGKNDEALDIFQNIDVNAPEDFPVESVLYQMAEIQVARNQPEEALALFNRIKDDYPQTYYAYEASREASRLEEKK
jgi:tetratricopeptide (TPR) repeat protein